jgi:adenylate cyclase
MAFATRTSEIQSWIALYESGLKAYRVRNAAGAGLLPDAAGRPRLDRPTRAMIERCRAFLKTPPREDWEATTALQAK